MLGEKTSTNLVNMYTHSHITPLTTNHKKEPPLEWKGVVVDINENHL